MLHFATPQHYTIKKPQTDILSKRFLVEVASGLEPLCPVLQTGD